MPSTPQSLLRYKLKRGDKDPERAAAIQKICQKKASKKPCDKPTGHASRPRPRPTKHDLRKLLDVELDGDEAETIDRTSSTKNCPNVGKDGTVLEQKYPLDGCLAQFSDSLVPPGDFADDGRQAAYKVFEILQENSRYPVDRMYLGGSTGKDTAIHYSDHDLIIFMNNQEPLFTSVVDEFERVFQTALAARKETLNLKILGKSKFTLQINLDGFKMDVVPAPSYITDTHRKSGFASAWQALIAFKRIDEDPSKVYWYGSALCESQLNFMRNQSEFTLAVVRLAKFWNRSLYIPDYMSGRSTFIELVAVYASRREEQFAKDTGIEPSVYSGFRRFLKFVSDFPGLDIEFVNYDPLAPLREVGERWKPEPTIELLTRVPRVIEPANPYNNLAADVKPVVVQSFVEFGRESIRRLKKARKKNPGSRNMDIMEFFRPQPTFLTDEMRKGAGVKEFLENVCFVVNVFVRDNEAKRGEFFCLQPGGESVVEDTLDKETFPLCLDMKVRRRGGKFGVPEMEKMLRFIQTHLETETQAYAYSAWFTNGKKGTKLRNMAGLLERRLEDRIVDFLFGWKDESRDEKIKRKRKGKEGKDGMQEEECDVIFQIPIWMRKGELKVSVSFWMNN